MGVRTQRGNRASYTDWRNCGPVGYSENAGQKVLSDWLHRIWQQKLQSKWKWWNCMQGLWISLRWGGKGGGLSLVFIDVMITAPECYLRLITSATTDQSMEINQHRSSGVCIRHFISSDSGDKNSGYQGRRCSVWEEVCETRFAHTAKISISLSLN